MPPVGFQCLARVPAATVLAWQRILAEAVTQAEPSLHGYLCVTTLPGDAVSLGRLHLAPNSSQKTPYLTRRLSGGRAVPAGDGFVGISLVLPHRSALESEDPLALGPAQVINRCVRGILEGCRLFGVDANYPGLDFVTVRGKVVGMVTFTVDDAGALLFEAVIANDREFSLLPFWLDTVDPDGCVKTELLAEDRTTCLRREIGSPLDPAEVGELVRRGYTARFGLNFEPVPFPLPPQGDAVTAAENEFSSPDWLKRRRLPGRPYRHAIRTGHLGLFEAYVRLAEDGRSLEDVTFAGDVIVNASGIERLESALCGCPAERHAIDATVRRVLDGQENFVLGIGPPSSVTDILCQSLD